MKKWALFVSVLLLSGCGIQASAAQARHAAQFDCQTSQLQTREISYGVYLVSGCGPKATYKCVEGAAVGMCELESVEQGGQTVTGKGK